MGPVLTNPVPLAVFWAFPRLTEDEQTYRPDAFEKHWADPNAVEALPGLGRAQYTVLAVDANNPNLPLLKNGKPYLTKVYLDVEEAKASNIPPDVSNYVKVGERGMPIDMAKWDAENYFLDLEGPMSTVVVKDRRATVAVTPAPAAADGFTADDRTRMVRIETMLAALLEGGR